MDIVGEGTDVSPAVSSSELSSGGDKGIASWLVWVSSAGLPELFEVTSCV